MITKITKFHVLLIAIIFTALLSAFSVNAQTGGACQVMSAEFRTSRAVNDDFMVDDINNRPFVYIDIETQNCGGEEIEVSITEDDVGLDDDVSGNLGFGQTCDMNTNNSSCMDNRVIGVINDDFTLSLKAGEDDCQSVLGIYDCNYHIETWDEVNSGQEWESGLVLDYECDVGCNENWVYVGILTNFEGTDIEDPDDSYDGTGPLDDGPGTGGGPLDDNPNTNNGQTTLELGLTNPLAGTIDDIPQLFQKIIYIVIKIGIPLVAIAILYSGFLFVTARGRDEQLKTAKNVLLFAVIGGLLLLASWLVAEAIRDALLNINSP